VQDRYRDDFELYRRAHPVAPDTPVLGRQTDARFARKTDVAGVA
jgi:hypothetical protein